MYSTQVVVQYCLRHERRPTSPNDNIFLVIIIVMIWLVWHCVYMAYVRVLCEPYGRKLLMHLPAKKTDQLV